jgi:predicted hydrocarbon binding protein
VDIRNLFTEWAVALITGLNAEADDETKARVMEYCGRACAVTYGSVETAKTVRNDVKGIDEFLEEINRVDGFWCGTWVRDGNAVYSVCVSCGCPLVLGGLLEQSPVFCNCSRGWVKAVFEEVFGERVEVKLENAIGRGDPVCKFVVSTLDASDVRRIPG